MRMSEILSLNCFLYFGQQVVDFFFRDLEGCFREGDVYFAFMKIITFVLFSFEKIDRAHKALELEVTKVDIAV